MNTNLHNITNSTKTKRNKNSANPNPTYFFATTVITWPVVLAHFQPKKTGTVHYLIIFFSYLTVHGYWLIFRDEA